MTAQTFILVLLVSTITPAVFFIMGINTNDIKGYIKENLPAYALTVAVFFIFILAGLFIRGYLK